MLTLISQSAPVYENYTIYQVRGSRINETATNLYQQLLIHDVPLYRTKAFLDAMCFPLFYPLGKNTQHDERQVRLRDCDFIKAKLTSINPRYRRNIEYIFYLLNDCKYRQLDGGIYQVLNLVNPKEKYNKKTFMEKLNNEELEANLCTIFSRLTKTQNSIGKSPCAI